MVVLILVSISFIIFGILQIKHVYRVRKRGWEAGFDKSTFKVIVLYGRDATIYDWVDLVFGYFFILVGFFFIIVILCNGINTNP